MISLARTPYFTTERDPKLRLVWVTRSAKHFETAHDLNEGYERMLASIAHVDRPSHCLIMDVRAAPLRNDPAFERAFQPFRPRLHEGFRLSAVIVATPVGRLQIERHARKGTDPVVVCSSVEDALVALRAAPS